jgi:hypothetical protein
LSQNRPHCLLHGGGGDDEDEELLWALELETLVENILKGYKFYLYIRNTYFPLHFL